mgnify:CR=1 FL=1
MSDIGILHGNKSIETWEAAIKEGTGLYLTEKVKRDMLKMMDKLDEHEQMFINLQRRRSDDYKLINDRITEIFDIIKMLEKEER